VTAVWLSLAFLVAALALGTAFAVVRGLALWRLFKRTGGTFGDSLERIGQAAASIESRLAEANAGTQRLGEASARLRDARARLDVQRAAVREAGTQVGRLLWFVPRR
jgi:hypothetical protein